MNKISFTIKVPRLKRRATELYDSDSPYRGRVEKSKKTYQRKLKHPKQVDRLDF